MKNKETGASECIRRLPECITDSCQPESVDSMLPSGKLIQNMLPFGKLIQNYIRKNLCMNAAGF
jgi:hypothetical protein